MLAFDLDGTLVDTEVATRKAYRWAGVKMPRGAWGKPWREWLNDPEAHAHKQRVYPIALKAHARALPLLQVAVRLNAPVLTGASYDTVAAILETFHVRLDVRLIGATAEDKLAWLSVNPRGTYVDDDARFRERVEEETPWSAISPEEWLRSS